jgi:hypothetical protein
MRRLVVFWNLRISIRAFTPGRNRRFFVGVLPAVVLPVGVFFPAVLLATAGVLLAAGVFLAEPAAAAAALLVPGLGDRD